MLVFEHPLCGLVVARCKECLPLDSDAQPSRRPSRLLRLFFKPPGLKPSYACNSPSTAVESPEPTPPIRVLIVAARFLPDLGGTETHIYEVTRRMAMRHDFDLTVLTTDRLGTRPVKEELEGFTVLRCRSYPQSRDYYFAPGIYRQVLTGHYDIVHCQGVHTAVPVLAMIAAKRRRIPYLVTLHTGGHSSSLRRRLRSIQWRALRPLLRGAETIIAVSDFEQQIIQERCALDRNHFRIIQNGGELPATGTPPTAVPGRIVSCGRLERYKGHQRAIEALPIVQRSFPHATLHILGSGPYEGALRSLINSLGLENSVRIECIASNDREQMARSLGEAAVVTALSEYEAHPVAVIEAVTLGIPTVGLDTAGMSYLVKDGLVKGVPKDASPTMVAQALVVALKAERITGSVRLPTWDTAAADLAHVYMDLAGAASTSFRS